MAGSKKQQKTEQVYTPVIPVVSCADETQVDRIMELCRIPRALTYNKLGSVKGWGLDGKKADPIVCTILKATDINLPSKLWEWSISDTMKAIAAPQEAGKVYLVREIWRKYPLSPLEKERRNWFKTAKSTKNDALLKFPKAETEILRDNLFDLLHNDPTANPWLHRILRKQYQRGHTFVKNQMCDRGGGYSDKRWMNYAEVRKVLPLPTVRYLTSIGKSVTEAIDLGWINPKLKAEVIRLEDEYHRQG